MRLIEEDLVLDGIPERNLATFVTTWMEPEAQQLIADNLHRNFIDHAEYPQTAEIEQRCIRMLANLFHAPGETTGARTQGSSEAIMLGALSLKWQWRKRREAAGASTDRPNLVFGGDVHVVWEKFCRYFDVEPRIVPLQPDKYTIGPEDVEPHIDENTIGVAAVLGTTFTGHADDIVGINKFLVELRDEKGLDVPLHVDGASGGFVWPFLYPDYEWDFRLEQVRSINVSGHKYGLVYPGVGWLIFREEADLAQDLVFLENYLGKTDKTFTLNFSTGSAMVLAQYYALIRFGHAGYTRVMEIMQANARFLAEKISEIGPFQVIGDGQGPASARGLQPLGGGPLRRVRHRLAGRGRARLDAARLHDAAERRSRDDAARPGQAQPQPRARCTRSPTTSPRRARRSKRRAARAQKEREQVKTGVGLLSPSAEPRQAPERDHSPRITRRSAESLVVSVEHGRASVAPPGLRSRPLGHEHVRLGPAGRTPLRASTPAP